MQIRKDAYPMTLIKDVLNHMGAAKWYFALDLQSGFWKMKMNFEDIKSTSFITKSSLYEWLVVLFGLKNATNTFSWTMMDLFFTRCNNS
jgi:hypothetical protein